MSESAEVVRLRAENERLKAAVRLAYPEIESLMRLARDTTNQYYKWVPGWLAAARALLGEADVQGTDKACMCATE